MYAKEIVDNLHIIHLGKLDSNVYVVDKELVIDTTTGLLEKHLLKMLEKIGVKAENVERVVNTHLHFDHIGGNFIFRNASVGMHIEDAKELEKNVEATYYFLFGGELKRKEVDFVVVDKHKIKTENFEFVVVHTPGHTKGSICLYEKNFKILISGDTIFHHTIGRTDLIGGNKEEMLSSLEKIAKLDVEMLLPGHGRIIESNANEKIRQTIEVFKGEDAQS